MFDDMVHVMLCHRSVIDGRHGPLTVRDILHLWSTTSAVIGLSLVRHWAVIDQRHARS
jgi:hypothetical protein